MIFMKKPPGFLLFCLLVLPLPAAPLPVILDTDMDSDVDDVSALGELHAMADRGEVEILGVMISGHNEWSAPCTDAIDTFYGRPDLPIGASTRPRSDGALLRWRRH